MESTISKIRTKINTGKTHAALGLAVATIAWLAPDDSSSYGCPSGTIGDCDGTTDGNYACTWGGFWDDCA